MNAHSVQTRVAVTAATLALAAIAGTASATVVTSWAYSGASLDYVRNDDGTFWGSYDTSPAVAGTPFANGIKLASTNEDDLVFSLNGNSYIPTPPPPVTAGTALRGNRLIMYGTATIDGTQWQHPDDTIRTHFSFGLGFSGGVLDLYTIETSFDLYDASNNSLGGVGSGTGLGELEPGGYGFGFDFVDRFGGDITSATRIEWYVAFYYDWTNYNENDTLDFFIGQNSVDIIGETVPTPGAAALLTLGVIPMARRRR